MVVSPGDRGPGNLVVSVNGLVVLMMEPQGFFRRQRLVGDVGLSDQRRSWPGARIECRGQSLAPVGIA